MEDDDRRYDEFELSSREELEAAGREQKYVDNAHYLLDVLLMTFDDQDKQKRIFDLDNFLKQIALIEDFEFQNTYTNDVEQLELLASRATNYAMRESFCHNISEDLARAVEDFLQEFSDLVQAIKKSPEKTYEGVINAERSGKMPVRFSSGYKFQAIPTTGYVKRIYEAIEQQRAQAERVAQSRIMLTQDEASAALDLVSQQPDKFLRLETKIFYYPELVEQLRGIAIQNFPDAYRKHTKKTFGDRVSAKEMEKAKKNFETNVDMKIQRETEAIRNAGNPNVRNRQQ